MSPVPPLRVIFFDLFGTCVAQRKPVADELWNAAHAALEADAGNIDNRVRARATQTTYEDWFKFGGEWNRSSDQHVAEFKKSHHVDWREVDRHRILLLRTLLADRGLVLLSADGDVQPGSLWNAAQLEHLGRVWHRLPPWTDTCQGLQLLNTKYPTVTLSNSYNALVEGLVKHSEIPFTKVYTSDMFGSFKPHPKVYLEAARRMGVAPEECALVAAHLFDLKAAKSCGYFTIYVERTLEEKNPELTEEGIPDLIVDEHGGGLITVASALGVHPSTLTLRDRTSMW